MEFANDYDTREFLQSSILRLQSLMDGMNNAKTLHDWDNYQASLNDYDYAKYKVGSNVPGFQTKVNEIGQFFAGRPTGSTQTAKKEDENVSA